MNRARSDPVLCGDRSGLWPDQALTTSIEVAGRAQEIDRLNHRPYLVKAAAHHTAGRHDDALFAAQRAFDLNPNDPDSLAIMEAIESRTGRPGSGIERLLQALRLSPLNPLQYRVHSHLSVAYFLACDYVKGVEWALLCKRAAPELVMNLIILIVNYVGLGRIEEARKEFEIANRLAPELLKERLAIGSPLFKLPEDRERDRKFLRIAAGLEPAPTVPN